RSAAEGVLGREYDWSQAECEFGQVVFTNVATHVKGNIASLLNKRPFRQQLDPFRLERLPLLSRKGQVDRPDVRRSLELLCIADQVWRQTAAWRRWLATVARLLPSSDSSTMPPKFGIGQTARFDRWVNRTKWLLPRSPAGHQRPMR